MKVCAIRCEVFSRVVGYYRPVESWNAGKREEFRDRVPLYSHDLMDALRDIASAQRTDADRAAAGTALDRLEAEVAPPVFGV